jgi:HEAT repeat protein
VDIGEANLDMDYRSVGIMGLDDSDAGVREAAVDLLFEDMSLQLMDKLIELAQWDDAPEVRAAAASALGRFILAGELGELPERDTTRAQDAAVSLLTNEEEDIDVRRRALEAIANCSHEIVDEAITEAYQSDEHKMRVSSLFAMGRSCDERWNPIVLRELQSNDDEMRFEAARAAGEIGTEDAVPVLVRLAFDNDREIKEVAIWSLGEIGGLDAKRALNKLAREAAEVDDADLLEAVEDALTNAQLADSLDMLDEYDD